MLEAPLTKPEHGKHTQNTFSHNHNTEVRGGLAGVSVSTCVSTLLQQEDPAWECFPCLHLPHTYSRIEMVKAEEAGQLLVQHSFPDNAKCFLSPEMLI